MTTKTSTRNAVALIAARQPFTTHGALSGATPGATLSHWDLGRLPRDHANAIMIDYLSGQLDYIVYSYGTPIAWHRADTGWTVPDVRYSVTTSRHQGVVRQAVS